jgi:hypothetical protein
MFVLDKCQQLFDAEMNGVEPVDGAVAALLTWTATSLLTLASVAASAPVPLTGVAVSDFLLDIRLAAAQAAACSLRYQ